MDDVTIEDEFDLNEDISSQFETKNNYSKWFYIYQILNQQWIILLLISIVIAIYFYINRNRRRNLNSTIGYNHNQGEKKSDDVTNRYDEMDRIRQRQQKAYEEQMLRYAEEKKAKSENLKQTIDEKPNRLKYRSNDYNPLTGQSTSGSGNSCSWRPSSRRKPGG